MKAKKVATHRYKVGDVVGICADCMADCEILECLPKVPGQAFSYAAKAITIHHPKPKASFFGQHEKFQVREKQIVVRLSSPPTNPHAGYKRPEPHKSHKMGKIHIEVRNYRFYEVQECAKCGAEKSDNNAGHFIDDPLLMPCKVTNVPKQKKPKKG